MLHRIKIQAVSGVNLANTHTQKKKNFFPERKGNCKRYFGNKKALAHKVDPFKFMKTLGD